MLLALWAGMALVLCSGCSGENSAPAELMDGSRPPELSVELADVGDPSVLTKVSIDDTEAAGPGSAVGACLGQASDTEAPSGSAVVRVGVAGESVSFPISNGLYACDNSAGPREEDRRWCGSAFGQLYGGRLRDPRLDIGCNTESGDPMGFVWVQPDEDARYVAVGQPGFTEVYEVAGDLPVRIATTTGVDVERSRAPFEVSEHDAAGALLRRYTLEAAVAG